MKIFLKKILTFASLLALTACVTPNRNPHNLPLMDEGKTRDVVEKWTQGTEYYSGLYNLLNLKATLINTEVATAHLHQKARTYLWDSAQFNSEQASMEQRLNTQTDVFISLYTPERKHDDLAKNKTLWKVFLDVNGQRYEGKATKIKLLGPEILSLYPYYSSFYTPYIVTFPISTKIVDTAPSKLTLTGAIGSVTLEFK